eukprot:TRINITY_DN8439_c0_g1_i1.p1 TRINITY_DN8439_c0_g1~~TRINITY_DN8439_c0_g1_i1.p1  ORF type:complete len:105 (+),score=28.96 TRINITY_DN8439_c0_g1_i1:185-499(+)
MASDGDLQTLLKPFHDRAAEAEERLARLETSIVSSKGNSTVTREDMLGCLKELRDKLEKAKAEQISEREKALKEQERLAAENAKLQYRIYHLVQAVKEAEGSKS